MALDYTKGAVNFRDLGEWFLEIAGKSSLPLCKIYRGGKIDFIDELGDIAHPRCILNLRRGPDSCWEVLQKQLCVPSGVDTNQSHDPIVRSWLNQVIQFLGDGHTLCLVYIPCTSGKDRTCIVAGVIGRIIGGSLDAICEEYALSEGNLHPDEFRAGNEYIRETSLEVYFNCCDLGEVKRILSVKSEG